MQIAGNILGLLLLPITLIACASMLAQYRKAGSDQVGPIFAMVIALAIRWLLAAVLIILVAARGGFEGLLHQRLLAVLLVALLVFALDATAWMAGTAAERVGAAAVGAQVELGRALAYALPIGSVLLLMFALNTPDLSAVLERLTAGGLAVLVVIAFAYFNAIDRATDARRDAKLDAFYAEQDQLAQPYVAALADLPIDAPVDQYAMFFQTSDELPGPVRGDVIARLQALPDLNAQLLAMLADDRRALAMQVLSRTGRFYEPAQLNVLIDANVQLAADYAARADVTDDDATATQIGLAAMLAAHFAAGNQPGVDFRRAIEAWNEALTHVHVENSVKSMGQHAVDQWLEYHPKPAGE